MTGRTWETLQHFLKAGAQHFLSSRDAQSASKAIATISELRGPFVKILQSVAMFHDLLPDELQEMDQVVCSNVPPMGPFFVEALLDRMLGESWKSRFKDFDMRAASAASLGQVHRATSLSGQPLAVKVQYPDVEKWLTSDLNLLRKFLSYRYGEAFDVYSLMTDIQEKIIQEIDYKAELQNMQIFSEYSKDYSTIFVPGVWPEESMNTFLVMDWAPGMTLSEYVTAYDQERRSLMGRDLLFFWLKTFFNYEKMHGDPHFGNYVFHEKGVTLLDFGNVLTLSSDFVRGVRLLFLGLDEDNLAKSEEAYDLLGFVLPNAAVREAVHRWACFLFQPLLSSQKSLIYTQDDLKKGAELFRSVLTVLKKEHGVTIPKSFVWFDRVIMSLGAVLYALKAEHAWRDVFEEAASFVKEN